MPSAASTQVYVTTSYNPHWHLPRCGPPESQIPHWHLPMCGALPSHSPHGHLPRGGPPHLRALTGTFSGGPSHPNALAGTYLGVAHPITEPSQAPTQMLLIPSQSPQLHLPRCGPSHPRALASTCPARFGQLQLITLTYSCQGVTHHIP